MTPRFGYNAVLILSVIAVSFGVAEAKRHTIFSPDTTTSPLPPPPEILQLAPDQCTIPRQSLYSISGEEKELARKLPSETWFKFKYDGKGGKEFKLVYSSSPDTAMANRCEDIARRLILRTPVDSNSTSKWYYHRIVLLVDGDKMVFNPNAIPVPGDLPKPVTVKDPDYTWAEIVKRGDLDVPDWASKPGHNYTVLLRYRVAVDGKVGPVQIQESSGSSTLDNIAVTAAYKNKCKPATRKGKPVESWVSDRIDFYSRTPDRLEPSHIEGE
jgi:TonB family protein